jgi:hypothetical protein
MAVFRPTTFGASPGGDPDINRDAFQAAINACSTVGQDEVEITNGDFILSKQANSNPWCVAAIGKNIRWRHESPSAQMSMRFDQANNGVPFGNHIALLYVWNYPGFWLDNAQMFGNKIGAGGPTNYLEPPEHHRAVFVREGTGLRVTGGYYHDFTGDGIQLYNDCLESDFEDVVMRWCQRDHITLSPSDPAHSVRGVRIKRCWLEGASNQNIDNEHGPAHDVEIDDCDLIWHANGSSSGLVIAAAGTEETNPSTNWDIHHCRIRGAIRATWAQVKIRSCDITYDFDRGGGLYPFAGLSCVEIERQSEGTEVTDNNLTLLNAPIDNVAGVYANGTLGGGAINLGIRRNIVNVSGRPNLFGLRLDGSSSAELEANDLTGPGIAATGYAGIRIRATVASRPVDWIRSINNRVRNFGQYGLRVVGTVGSPRCEVSYLLSSGDEFENTVGTAQSVGFGLDDGLGALKSAFLDRHRFGAGVVTGISSLPPGASISGRYSSLGITPRTAWYRSGALS